MKTTKNALSVLCLFALLIALVPATAQGSGYLREADIIVRNQINPDKAPNLGLTLAGFELAPGGGEWTKEPSNGTTIKFGENPGQWSVTSHTYPGEAKGRMIFVVQDGGRVVLEFHSSLNGFGVTVNGDPRGCVVEGFLFTLETHLNPVTDQPIFILKAVQFQG